MDALTDGVANYYGRVGNDFYFALSVSLEINLWCGVWCVVWWCGAIFGISLSLAIFAAFHTLRILLIEAIRRRGAISYLHTSTIHLS